MMSKEGFFSQILRLFMETETKENKVGDLGMKSRYIYQFTGINPTEIAISVK